MWPEEHTIGNGHTGFVDVYTKFQNQLYTTQPRAIWMCLGLSAAGGSGWPG